LHCIVKYNTINTINIFKMKPYTFTG